MKKIIQTLVLILAVQAVFSQSQCQAFFTYNYDGQSLLSLYDNSYVTDSSLINVTAWNWTVTCGGAIYTDTVTNPVFQILNSSASATVCLTISTSNGCQSTVCDSVYLNNPPMTCNADFMYQNNGLLNTYSFTDLSTVGNPASGATITSWNWTIYDYLQNTLLTSNQQNLSFTFPGNGTYDVCLTIATDDSCGDTQCYFLTVGDTVPNNCFLNVNSNISDVTVIGGNDGFIDLTVTGYYTPYIFSWSNGATTEDIYGLTSGIYTVSIAQNDSLCPPYSYTFQILEPTQIVPIDTLLTNPIDSCLNFTVDSFYVAALSVQGNVVTVTWVFTGNGTTVTFPVTYVFGSWGTYMVVLVINCNKSSDTYSTYINITSHLGVDLVKPSDISIYPNPFTGSFSLNLPGVSKADILIFNSTGQMIYSAKTSDVSNSVNSSTWPAGIYLLRVINGNKQIITRTVVKQ
ncbi:MAG: T9SS type A sorting domain-containing protein [Bacteroidia bacterium]|nr:T9SS type A sorting domain-containing protein [Bacteroidia bacterium]